jgi:hypothetical protein
MADFFRGLSGGLQTGLQFGQAMREGEERKRLREAAGLTPQEMQQRQASPEELARAQAETQALAAEDARMFGLGPQEQAAYAPQMPVEGQRVGLPRYQLAGQTFDRAPTQQEIQQARFGAMADVISERDPARAMQMRQQLEDQAYQARIRPLQEEQLRGSIAGQAQQRELTGIQLGSAKRTEAELQRASDFSNFAAENPNATVAELKDAAFKQFKFTPKQWQETVTTRLGIENAEMDSFKNGIKKKLQGKNLSQLGSLYNSDPDFDDKTDLAIVPGKGGAVTLNFIDKASGRVTSTQSFKNEALATEYLNKQATEPETIGSWMMALRKTESGIEAQGAATRASDATVGLRNRQMQMLSNQAAGNAEAQTIRAAYEALTPEEQVGPKGQGLIRQFNMANAKAGMAVPLGAAPRAERPALSEADKTARAKAMVEARDIDPITNKKFTLSGAIKFLEGGSRDQIGEALDKALGGSDPFAPPTPAATPSRPAAAPTGLQTQTARNAPVEPNPYVDARGRPLAVTPAGAPSVASTAVPAAAAAVENALGTQAAATRYLQAKIARNEPLSPTERARAQQMGLIR